MKWNPVSLNSYDLTTILLNFFFIIFDYFLFILSFANVFSFAGCLRYKVDFQSFQLDDEDNEFFDLDDY